VTSDAAPAELKERNPVVGCGCLILLVLLLFGLARSCVGGDGEAASATVVVSTPAPGTSAARPATIPSPVPDAAAGPTAGAATGATSGPHLVREEDCADGDGCASR
jgi:hypothetical protein